MFDMSDAAFALERERRRKVTMDIDKNSTFLDIIKAPEQMRHLLRDKGNWFIPPTMTTGMLPLAEGVSLDLEIRATKKAESLPKLRFVDPKYSIDSPNTTIRLSEKWFQDRSSMVMLCDNDKNYLTPAEIAGRRLTLLGNVTISELSIHHTTGVFNVMSLWDLYNMLGRIYPSEKITRKTMVTVLTFVPVGWGALL
jgi:hypothetical protein